jgi:N-methylhydantoinase B/oxoprolinase/acetone carboxylase alpha subunit
VTLDPASLQILISRLSGVADEMSAVLRRAAYSPNIKERADCSAAVFGPDGELLAQAENIPVHLGSMPASVRAAIEACGDGLEPGDQVILNDPFAGGTHLNDITVVAPVHLGGVGDRLIGWVANRAHHADVGGDAPGSMPADATDIAQEGLRLGPQRLTPAVRARVAASSRTPGERAGDLDAQVGANAVGVRRLAELADQPFAEVLAHGERRMRAAVAALPDGTWRFADVIDSSGSAPDQQAPSVVALALTVAGDQLTFDFSGSEPQRAGNVNAVEAVTVSAVSFAVRAGLDPSLPANAGTLRPVTVIAPAGTIVNASAPAAVGAGNVEVSQRVADVCFGALAQVLPGRVPAASQGTMNNLLLGNDRWVYYETLAGGQGGRPDRGGMSGVHTHMTNTRNTPIEALERAFPLRVRRLRLRRGSGGAGRHPGGEGIERDLEVLEAATLSLITERRRSAPWGLDGGQPGAVGENWLLPGGDESRARPLPDKCTIQLQAGDVVRILTPGGGGWGPVSTPSGPAA